MAAEIELEVPGDLDGERADKAIAALLDLSRARAAAVAADGFTIDGVKASPSQRVRTGQEIRCRRPDVALRLLPEPVEFGVLYEDEAVVVVDKPAGLVVHPGSGQEGGTLAAGLLDRYPELVGVGAEDRWGLIHRLDKDSSGALLVARTAESFASLSAQLREREVERRYLTLVEGLMGAQTGTIDAPIGRDPSRPTRRAVTHVGKQARTHYEVMEEFPDWAASFLEVTLETGRTHQIRVHLAAIEHPVAGDVTYGATRKDLQSPRTFLHAARLEFTDPVSGDRRVVESPLPADLDEVLTRLS